MRDQFRGDSKAIRDQILREVTGNGDPAASCRPLRTNRGPLNLRPSQDAAAASVVELERLRGVPADEPVRGVPRLRVRRERRPVDEPRRDPSLELPEVTDRE